MIAGTAIKIRGSALTLSVPAPSEMPGEERMRDGWVEDTGFVCMPARKE